MSIKAVSAVILASIQPPTVKLAAVVLAEALNEKSGQLNLSLATIAERVGISRDQARRCVHALIADQVLSVVANAAGGAPGAAPHYRMHLDRLRSTPQTGGTDAIPTGGTDATPDGGQTGGAGAVDGWHPRSRRVAPMQQTGGTHATRTGRNRIEPEGNQVAQPIPETLSPASKRRRQVSAGEVTLAEWLQVESSAGRPAVPSTDPIFGYAEGIGLPREFLHLAWFEFKASYTADPVKGEKPKTYTDWRAVFRKSVRGNWQKLWYLDGQQYALTTAGQQARRAVEAVGAAA